MSNAFPEAIFSNHIADVGKTGSGKTITAKAMVEQIYRTNADARICIIDPIKSDHWGLTRSKDGKGLGLPFRVLGGPFGHVGLHAAAGAAIGGVVASGALRHCIIDMHDFDLGEPARFFIAFAHALFKQNRGVLHLVVEEAHVFAPKEKPGFGEETKSAHWMNKLATAGRSKGIRLIVCTQRVQALHNAVLSSCETLIAHRLPFPADQKPIAAWLSSSISKDKAKEIEASLSRLKTGEGWVCSGELGIIEKMRFPMIQTYDNSATPTHDDTGHDAVRPPSVDDDELKTIIGDAVEEVEANDPKKLKDRVWELERELELASREDAKTQREDVYTKSHMDELLNNLRIEIETEERERLFRGIDEAIERLGDVRALYRTKMEAVDHFSSSAARWPRGADELNAKHSFADTCVPKPELGNENAIAGEQFDYSTLELGKMPDAGTLKRMTQREQMLGRDAANAGLSKAERAILGVLMHFPKCGKTKLALLGGYAHSGGGFNNALSSLRTKGYIAGSADIEITNAGREVAPYTKALPKGPALLKWWAEDSGKLGKCERAILYNLVRYGAMKKGRLATATGYEASGGGFNNSLSRLRTLELIQGKDELRASDVFRM